MTSDAAGRGARSPAEPAALELNGVARRFGGRWVLRGVSLRLGTGQAAALLGRNGSGKTTLLRIAATLLRATRGEAAVFGHALDTEPDAARRFVGFLGHAPGLYEDLTAADNLRFAARMRGHDADDRAIGAVLERVGLAPEAGGRVRSFSSGMRRRLALGRLMLGAPRLVLLDEPYASFDPEGIALVDGYVREVTGRGGAVLVATHDLPRARAVVDRVLALRDGRLEEQPLPSEPRLAVLAGREGRGSA